jgi:hypothetical protein
VNFVFLNRTVEIYFEDARPLPAPPLFLPDEFLSQLMNCGREAHGQMARVQLLWFERALTAM